MKKSIRLSLTALLALVFLVSMTKLLTQQQDNTAGSSSYSDAIALASSKIPLSDAPQPATEPTPVPEILQWVPAPLDEEDPHIQTMAELDLEALREVNPDVVGWIMIPNTQINYPLLQGEDNAYYLNHTWEGRKNSVGSIFLEHLSNPDLTDFNTIIYGHNMKNGSMFAGLHTFRYQSHFDSHPYVYLRTDAGAYRYEIFAAYRADVESSTYALHFPDERYREAFIKDALESSVIETGVQPEVNDRILTLSTCSGAGYSNRWVVQARLKMVQEVVD